MTDLDHEPGSEAAGQQVPFRVLVATVPVAMGLVDLGGRFLDVNPAMIAFLHHTREELGQLSLADVTHPDDVAVDLALQQELLSGHRDAYRLQKRFVRNDGADLWGDF